ncbi:MAG: DoxX family membrane protein [Ignavibacteriaceae bacterium]
MKILTSKPIRFAYAIFFAVLGISHIINASTFKEYIPSFLPGGIIWVYLLSAFMIVASVSIIFKRYTKITCLILSIVLLLVVFIIHIPGLFNPNSMQISMINVLRDTGLAGGGLILAGVIGVSEAE